MCVSFDPETIYKNAFYAFKRNNSLLHKSDIVKFCSILHDEVLKNTKVNIKYKYIYFEFDRNTLSSFYENYFGTFNVIGDNIYLNKVIEQDEISEVNVAYDQYTKIALDNTRQIFNDFLKCTVAV